MNVDEYQRLALRSARLEGDLLVNAALGLCGESAEIIVLAPACSCRGALLEECGDALWYVALGATALGMSLSRVLRQDDLVDESRCAAPEPESYARWLVINTGIFADLVKKLRFHGHFLDQRLLAYRLELVYRTIDLLVGAADGTPAGVAQANIEKLARRYPDGFSVTASINRAV